MSDVVRGQSGSGPAVSFHRQTIRGVDLNVADFGGEGPAMVLVHGLGGSTDGWLVAGPLLAQSAHVVAVDLPGFGRTALADGANASVQSNRAILDAFLTENFHEPVILGGNSMGGMIAMMEAAERPEVVAGLILVDPAIPIPSDVEPDPVVHLVFTTYATEGAGEDLLAHNAATLTPETAVDQRLNLQCFDPERVPSAIREAMIESTRRRNSEPWVNRAYLEAARSLMAMNSDPDGYHELIRSITTPTLLIQGARDRLIPLGAADAVAALQPEWTYVVLSDVGHIPQVEVPGEFTRAVAAWLRDRAAEGDLVSSARD